MSQKAEVFQWTMSRQNIKAENLLMLWRAVKKTRGKHKDKMCLIFSDGLWAPGREWLSKALPGSVFNKGSESCTDWCNCHYHSRPTQKKNNWSNCHYWRWTVVLQLEDFKTKQSPQKIKIICCCCSILLLGISLFRFTVARASVNILT